MSKLVKPSEVEYMQRDRLRLVNLNTQSVLLVRGLYTRWHFFDDARATVAYSTKNVTLEEALTSWQDLDPSHHFIFLLKPEEHESSYDVLRDRTHSVPFQQEEPEGSDRTDVGGKAQRCNILCKSLGFLNRIFYKRSA